MTTISALIALSREALVTARIKAVQFVIVVFWVMDLPNSVLACGTQGHRVIALIAQSQLTAKARAEVGLKSLMSYVTIPVAAWILYTLFRPESSQWFEERAASASGSQ